MLCFTDPPGDDQGLAYQYPQAALFQEAGRGYADLLGLCVEEGEELVLRVRLARYPNPLEAPLGFSLATVAVYLDTGPGGEEVLPGAGFRTPKGEGWEVAFLLTGFGGEKRTPEGEATPVRAEKVGEELVLHTGLPPGAYGYYVAVGLYDPFAPWFFRPAALEPGPWTLAAPPGMPNAVDVLAEDQTRAYQTGVLPPVRKTPPPYPALLALGLGAVSFLLAFLLRK
ncbi:glucodextranase DOMON-like domain-containing protein [Thermus filiformis]|uniref:Membrane protein n=1 Tax=Thermus filiformis TaxID=276 RepID=A0A0A2WUH0_THEFI|nr:glucodextranase DOMON-like domain-containing protein [Thermus filiformis]KGQ22422.2 membrane protein [Thermus filiformis]